MPKKSYRIRKCECGCGKWAKPGNRFIHRHQTKGKNNPMYGKRGQDSPLYGRSISEGQKKIIGEANRGRIVSLEFRKMISERFKGKPKSEEHKRKIGEAHKGKKFTTEHRRNLSKTAKNNYQEGRVVWNKGLAAKDHSGILDGVSHPMYGKIGTMKGRKFVRSEETKERLSIARKKYFKEHPGIMKGNSIYGSPGSKNSNWRGGKSSEPYCIIWSLKEGKEYKRSIMERDNFKCMNTFSDGEHKGRLMVHHVNGDKKDCSIKNLITLCVSCNSKANFDRLSWIIFYQQMMEDLYNYKYEWDK